MINTVIFDIGNVLVEWHWRKSFAEWFGEELVEPLADATVRSPGWLELDRGELSEAEIIALLTQNAPEYAEQIARIVSCNHEMLSTFPYADNWLRSLKAAGYRVYILSNFGDFSFNRAKPTFTFLQYADGGVISYEVKRVKPGREIYEILCEKYGITPENAVFLDDRPENTAAAAALGMHTVAVESKEQADAELRALGVTY